MLSLGHTAFSYLITQIPPFSKTKLNRKEIFLVLLSGNIYDLDVVGNYLNGTPIGAHHLFFWHTPLAGLLYFTIFYLIFRKVVNSAVFPVIALALFSHLILDDLFYLLNLFNLTSHIKPEIFWLYPFDERRKAVFNDFLKNQENYHFNLISFMEYYTTKVLAVFILEIVFIFTAIIIFIRKVLKTKSRRTKFI